jgi:hypothetical protein
MSNANINHSDDPFNSGEILILFLSKKCSPVALIAYAHAKHKTQKLITWKIETMIFSPLLFFYLGQHRIRMIKHIKALSHSVNTIYF